MTSKEKHGKGRLSRTEIRAARRDRRNRRRRILRTATFSAVLIVALLFIFSLFAGSLPISFGGGQSGVGQRYPDQGGNIHIDQGESHPPYNSTPATSGWHYSAPGLAPAKWGIHSDVLPDEVLVHNLEHGGVAFAGLPAAIESLANHSSETRWQAEVAVIEGADHHYREGRHELNSELIRWLRRQNQIIDPS